MILENSLKPTDSNPSRKILFQTESFEVVSIEWSQKTISEHHNHGWSQCSVLIEEGEFRNTLDLGSKVEIQVLSKGQVLTTPVGSHHEMRCLSNYGRTLHVYSPKIQLHSEITNFKPSASQDLKAELSLSEPTSIENLKKALSAIRENSITTYSPYFMNQLFAGVMPQMLMAEELISQTKTTLATIEASPAFSQVEVEVVNALGAIIGWDKENRDGVCVPGGSAANFMALHLARHKAVPDYKTKGMAGKSRMRIFTSTEAHYSIKKASVALGFGSDSVVLIPVDKFGSMDVQKLDEQIELCISNAEIPLMVCATSGTTVLGAFDNINQISKVCKKSNTWLHVDGAWGGPALFSKRIRNRVHGIEFADSVTFDAHKLFGASLTSSFLLTQHPGLLRSANDVSGADYLFHSDDGEVDRGKLSWQCGRSAEAASFWTIWKSLGTEGLGNFVDQLLEVRDQTLAWVKTQPRLILLSEPEYLNVCLRVVPSNKDDDIQDWSRKVREVLKEKNLAMVNYSTNSEGHFLRLILVHPYLKFENVRQILEWALSIK